MVSTSLYGRRHPIQGVPLPGSASKTSAVMALSDRPAGRA